MMQSAAHTYHIATFGCQMNTNDSERLSALLSRMGMSRTGTPEEADVAVLNTCSVRESAENRVFGAVANLAKLKKEKQEMIICVTGCMPGRDRDGYIQKKMPDVDLFFPIKDMLQLPSWLASLNPAFRKMEDLPSDYLSIHPAFSKTFQAFVTIQTGCNHFCTYCVVPYARGLEVNRPLCDILSEIRGLSESGCREVTLLGQIVNHYIAPDPEHFSQANPYKKNGFARLLWEVNGISGIERIHWTAPHPLYMDDEAVDALLLPHQVNYIHLPMQSGSTEVLKRMNRRHTREQYLDVIRKIREKKPNIAIGTDIIVGFCGETEEQFQETVEMYQLCDFDISYHAQYSERSGTLAPKIYADDVPKAEKKRRWQVLQDLMEDTTYRKNQRYVNTAVSVLIDSKHGEWCEGNSQEMKRVRIKGDMSLAGQIVEADIFRAETWILYGNKK